MKDKNGKEITHGCYVRIKYRYNDEDFNSIFKVNIDGFWGCKMTFVEDKINDIPYYPSLGVRGGYFSSDYVNNNFNRLALNTREIIEDIYSNDIEVIDYEPE